MPTTDNSLQGILVRAGLFVTGAQEIAAAVTALAGAGVTVVNDLTTGGTTTALSAEQGKNLNTAMSGKQATLVSGTSIKTVNGSSLLGSGDLTVAGGGGGGTTGTVVSFTTALPLDTAGAGKKFAEQSISAATAFTLGASPVEEGNLSFSLLGDGDSSHVPSWPTGWTISGGAFKTAAGQQNLYSLIYQFGTVLVFRTDGRVITTPPGATTGLSASMGSTLANLSWTAPSTGGIVVDYLVEYKTAAAGSWTTWTHAVQTTTTIQVSGLTSVTDYNFRVSATNPGGAGAAATANGTTSSPVTTLASDTFTAADGAAINGRVTPVGSLTWSGDAMVVSGNQARAPIGDWGSCRVNVATSSYTVSADIPALGDTSTPVYQVGVVFRASSTRNEQLLALAYNADTIRVYKASFLTYGDYTFHLIGTGTGTGIASKITVDVTPTAYTVRGSTGAVAYSGSDSFNGTETRCGIHSGFSSGRIDNFLVTT